jgi:hypothetical protein
MTPGTRGTSPHLRVDFAAKRRFVGEHFRLHYDLPCYNTIPVRIIEQHIYASMQLRLGSPSDDDKVFCVLFPNSFWLRPVRHMSTIESDGQWATILPLAIETALSFTSYKTPQHKFT